MGLAPDSRSSQKASLILLSMPPPPPDLANWLMSKPAEKALEPLPVMTMAEAAGEAWARRRQSKRAARTGLFVFLGVSLLLLLLLLRRRRRRRSRFEKGERKRSRANSAGRQTMPMAAFYFFHVPPRALMTSDERQTASRHAARSLDSVHVKG